MQSRAQEVDKLVDTKLDSVKELKKKGLLIMSELPIAVNYKIVEITTSRGISLIDLATVIGESKQHMSAIFRGKTYPKLEILLKISFVLNIPLEDLFEVDTQELWVVPAENSNGQSVYIDMSDLEVITTTTRRERLKENSFEYYDTKDKIFLTKDGRRQLEKSYVEDGMEEAVDLVRAEMKKNDIRLSEQKISAEAGKLLKEEFAERYITLYRQLGYQKTPYRIR